MGSANEVPFCFAGYDALDIRWGVLIPGLTGLAITSHRPRNFGCARSTGADLGSQRWQVLAIVGSSSGHDRPDDACGFVRKRDCGDTRRLSGREMGEPWVGSLRLILRVAHQGGHADNEQLAKVLIAHLGDAPEPLFAAA